MLDRFRSIYRIDFVDGQPRVRHGRPPFGFVSACGDIARLYGIRSGHVECLGQGRSARLRFSDNIPERARQPFRNVWTPPTAPGPTGGRRMRG